MDIFEGLLFSLQHTHTHTHTHRHFLFLFCFVFLLIKTYFIGGQFLHNVVLVSVAQQSESAICIHISPLLGISFPLRSPQSIE